MHSYLYNKYHNYTTAHPAVPAQAFNKKHKYTTAHPAVPAQASQQKSGEVKVVKTSILSEMTRSCKCFSTYIVLLSKLKKMLIVV